MLKNVGTNSHVLGDTACKAASLLEGVALPLPHPVPADLVPLSTTPNFRAQWVTLPSGPCPYERRHGGRARFRASRRGVAASPS